MKIALVNEWYTENIIFIWLSSLWILSVPDECHSRNTSCALNLISTFLSITHVSTNHVNDYIFFSECPSQTFGQNCSQTCGQCSGGSTCDHVTGSCENGCADGYVGMYCNISKLEYVVNNKLTPTGT